MTAGLGLGAGPFARSAGPNTGALGPNAGALGLNARAPGLNAGAPGLNAKVAAASPGLDPRGVDSFLNAVAAGSSELHAPHYDTVTLHSLRDALK